MSLCLESGVDAENSLFPYNLRWDWSKQEPARIQHLWFEIIHIDAFHGMCVWPLNKYWGSHARLFKHVLWQLCVPTGDIKTVHVWYSFISSFHLWTEFWADVHSCLFFLKLKNNEKCCGFEIKWALEKYQLCLASGFVFSYTLSFSSWQQNI